jgi:hypothetical protein
MSRGCAAGAERDRGGRSCAVRLALGERVGHEKRLPAGDQLAKVVERLASASSTGAQAWSAGAGALSIAATMYREMDMRFWLEQAEAELGRA